LASLPKEILAEEQNVAGALALLKEAMSRTQRTGVELTAMATCMHNVYNGVENILKQVLRQQNVTLPPSPTWHKDLLNHAISTHVVSADLGILLFDYLGFRHFFVHAYGFKLDAEQISDLAQDIQSVWDRFTREVAAFFRS
jgi:hypothetical protein